MISVRSSELYRESRCKERALQEAFGSFQTTKLSSLRRLKENLGAVHVELTPDDLRQIEAAAAKITIQGARYAEELEKRTGLYAIRDGQGIRKMNRKGDAMAMTWTSDELNKIGATEELQIAPLRRDGTLRNPVTIWVVRVGDDLYVRSWRGRTGAWFRGAQVRHEGRIWAGGVEKDVTFVEESDPAINDQIDVAYRAKYRRYPQYVNPMVTPEARATTIKLVPR